MRVKPYLFEGGPLYAVLDGASIPNLPGRLHQDKPAHECLFLGKLKPDMAQVAPYLVKLEENSSFTDWVLQEGWGKHWGVFATSAADLPELHRHFRRFLTVAANGGRMLFRYYDPRVLRTYLPTCNARELSIVFGPVDCYLVEGEAPSTLLEFRAADGRCERRERPIAAG